MAFHSLPGRFFSHNRPATSHTYTDGYETIFDNAEYPPMTSVYSPQAFNALSNRYRVLARELRECMAVVREAREETAAVRSGSAKTMEKLEEENRNLRAENEDLGIAYQEVIRDNEKLRKAKLSQQDLGNAALGAIDSLHKQEMDIQKNKYAELEHEKSLLKIDKEALEDLQEEEFKKRRGLQKDVQALEARLEKETQRATNLQSKVDRLESEQAPQEDMGPLIEIGAAVRLRYLQQARKMVTGQQWSPEVIEKGNAAAHRGNGAADATLLRSNFLSAAESRKLSTVFFNLYKVKPSDHEVLPPKMLEAMDCDATLRTTAFLRKDLESFKPRLLAMEQIGEICKKYDKLSKESFEINGDVEWRLNRVRELTVELVEMARMGNTVCTR